LYMRESLTCVKRWLSRMCWAPSINGAALWD